MPWQRWCWQSHQVPNCFTQMFHVRDADHVTGQNLCVLSARFWLCRKELLQEEQRLRKMHGVYQSSDCHPEGLHRRREIGRSNFGSSADPMLSKLLRGFVSSRSFGRLSQRAPKRSQLGQMGYKMLYRRGKRIFVAPLGFSGGCVQMFSIQSISLIHSNSIVYIHNC